MIFTTGYKIRLAFIIPTIVTLLALGSFNWFMYKTRYDSTFINVIGLQRKLTQQLQDFTHMVYIGQEEDKEELSRTISEFSSNLEVFENSGQIMQRQLPALPAELTQELTAVTNIWSELKPRLNLILEKPGGSKGTKSAYQDLIKGFPKLTEASHKLVLAYEERVDTLRDQMFYIMVIVTLLTLSSTITGVWVVRRYTNEQQLTAAKLRKENEEQEQLVQQLQDAHSQLIQSEKLASIGQLAAGIAHEINNPVGYINSNIGSLKRALSDLFKLLEHYEAAEDKLTDEDTRQHLKTVKQEVDIEFLKEDLKDLLSESQEGIVRVKCIVQDLKDFAHMEEADWQWADIHKGLNSTLNIVNNEIKYKAEVIKEYGDVPEVECIVSQLNQVFMNLLVNAAHAIEKRGIITIRTGQEEDNIWVSVEDTGKGMDAATQQKIFDPFFTTKGIGKGTGLGLSLSYSIIQKHNGSINVESELGKGTTFRIQLPIKQSEHKAES
jgi:signal transduction histidine kinase